MSSNTSVINGSEEPNQKSEDWYEEYYKRRGADRNDMLTNPQVPFQVFAQDYSIIKALRDMKAGLRDGRVLDVGCGSGAILSLLLRLGFAPKNLHGVDIISDRINEAKRLYPSIQFVVGDAMQLPYDSNSFDLVTEGTMFAQLTDASIADRVALEMLRVTRPGGYLLVLDWRYKDPWDPTMSCISKRKLKKLFRVGSICTFEGSYGGALVPPIGRRLSSTIPSLYFLIWTLCPFLIGQTTTVLRKMKGSTFA